MRGLSRLYRLKGDLEKSLKMIDKAINISPRNGELYFQKGKTLEFMGESDEAELSYQKAISYGNDRIIEK
ncbi:MAG: tetratricopeptide repeat protein, partial [Desulfotignum sp.]